MPTALLADRAIVDVAGPDAEHFLQNILTLDLDTIVAGEVRPGALLSPQGKVMFDFLVSRIEGGLRFDVRQALADDFAKRLMLYRLRAKAEIRQSEQLVVGAEWDADSVASSDGSGWLADRRFADATVWRIHAAAVPADSTPADYDALRVANGVAESGTDFEAGDAFPHDILLDQNGGVGFRKGCYIGQEVVSRMQHRGTARRRVVLVRGSAMLPPAGTPVLANGRPIGALGTVSGNDGLALVRIDKVADARAAGNDVSAADTVLSLGIPVWAKFGWPETGSGTEEA